VAESETSNIIITSLDLVYAQALLELASESGKLEEVRAEVQSLLELAKTQPDLGRLLSNRMISRQQRTRLVKSLFEGRVGPLVYKFLQVLDARDRLHIFAGIVAAFEQVYEEHQGIQAVTAYVPSALDGAEAQRISDALSAKLQKKVKLQQKIDEELIGGIKIRVGDNVIDGSVQAQLRLIRQDLLQAGRVMAAKAVGKA
jgi:F-type H+-transporting ATPase subunit delta